jgi:hypothetical protein
LSLQRQQPTLALCKLLSNESTEREVLQILDELARNDVIYSDDDGYRFSSTALRESLLRGMDAVRLEQNHRRLGEAFLKLAGDENPALRIEAGWHLIQGGDQLRGADEIAAVASDAPKIQTLIANLHEYGKPLEAALKVYQWYRRSIYQRLPLLVALSHSGYYEDRCWLERYGDQALDVLEILSGMRTVRRLTPILGRRFALGVGVLLAYIRFRLIDPRERRFSFYDIYHWFIGVATVLTGSAALALDSERAERAARVLEPFAILPEHWSPFGIFQFCFGLKEIGRENAAFVYATFDKLIPSLENPNCYRSLRDEARRLYLAAAHFARASFAIFRADGQAALESAAKLDAIGLKTYAMIASQLRYLYYTIRGELTQAAPHREQVELHAAHVGSAWQVETWDAVALSLVHPASILDVVGSTRLVHRLELLSRYFPSLKRYIRLARFNLMLVRGEPQSTRKVEAAYESFTPRSYIGWAATMAALAHGYNELGNHVDAKRVCDRALAYVTEQDLEYVMLFIGLYIELAIALAGVGRSAEGLTHVDRLIERFSGCEHPLLHGILHEARARITWSAGMSDRYAISLAEVERLFRSSGSSSLIAKYDRLAQLRYAEPTYNALSSTSTRPPASPNIDAAESEEARDSGVTVSDQEQTIVDSRWRKAKKPTRR